jgi:hypothetical protein
MKLSKLIYLASPYTHSDMGVRERRARHAAKVAGHLISQGYNVFCPIAHSHFIAEHSTMAPCGGAGPNYEDGEVHKTWMRVDLSIFESCDEVYVLMLDGYKESKGVQEELAEARLHGKQITYITEDGIHAGTEEPFYTGGG